MNTALTFLIQETTIITQLRKVASVLNWDRETAMPINGGKARADQISLILSMAHTRFTGTDFRRTLGHLIDLESGQIRNGHLSPEQTKLVFTPMIRSSPFRRRHRPTESNCRNPIVCSPCFPAEPRGRRSRNCRTN